MRDQSRLLAVMFLQSWQKPHKPSITNEVVSQEKSTSEQKSTTVLRDETSTTKRKTDDVPSTSASCSAQDLENKNEAKKPKLDPKLRDPRLKNRVETTTDQQTTCQEKSPRSDQTTSINIDSNVDTINTTTVEAVAETASRTAAAAAAEEVIDNTTSTVYEKLKKVLEDIQSGKTEILSSPVEMKALENEVLKLSAEELAKLAKLFEKDDLLRSIIIRNFDAEKLTIDVPSTESTSSTNSNDQTKVISSEQKQNTQSTPSGVDLFIKQLSMLPTNKVTRVRIPGSAKSDPKEVIKIYEFLKGTKNII